MSLLWREIRGNKNDRIGDDVADVSENMERQHEKQPI